MKGRIVIADDHWVVRHAMKSLLVSRPDLEVVGEASDGHQVLSLAQLLKPDLIILDISLPGLTGMQVLEHLKGAASTCAVLVFTMHPADQYLKHVIALGARGFISKDSESTKIGDAIDAILAGNTAFPSAKKEEFKRRRNAGSSTSTMDPLSKREDEVLQGLVHGERNSVIALRLNISAKTVATYRLRILEKLNVENNAELVALATQSGLVAPRQSR